jgi:hypothetical protein
VIQSCFNQQYLWLVPATLGILEREREIKWESSSNSGHGCTRRYCQVMTEGRDLLSSCGWMSKITETQAGKSRRWHPQQCRENPSKLSV